MSEIIPIEVARCERSFADWFHLIPPFDAGKAAKLFGIPARLIGDPDGTNYSSSHIALEEFKRGLGLSR